MTLPHYKYTHIIIKTHTAVKSNEAMETDITQEYCALSDLKNKLIN